MRRFEHPNGRFWTIDHSDRHLEIRWGKTGTAGQVRNLMLEAGTDARVNELVAKQLADGYLEVTDPPTAVTTSAPAERWFRRFEDGTQFRELTLDGRHVQQRTGYLRPLDGDIEDEEVASVEHPSPEAAREIMAKILAATMRAGFVLVAELDEPPLPLDAPPRPVVSNPELEHQCRAGPDHAETWGVYADWLMANGDVRGEIAALHARGNELGAAQLFDLHKAALYGQRNGVVAAVKLTSWRHGFPIAATIRIPYRDDQVGSRLASVTSAFLERPVATFIDALRFGLADYSNANDWRPTLDAVIASRHAPRIRELRFDDYDYGDNALAATPFGDLTGAFEHLPRLEELRIRSGAGGTLGTLVLPALKKFVRVSSGLGAHEIESIANATWPKLEHLEVWFGGVDQGAEGDVPRIQRILDGDHLPALRHLGIVNAEFSDSLVPALAASRLLPRLRTLDLSKGVAADAVTTALIEHAGAFRHLESIDLGENLMSDVNVSLLQVAFTNLRLDGQRTDEMDGDARYAAVVE